MLAILQFDSASLPVLETMLAGGRLPALARLRRSGRWETVDARATLLQSSTYMTLCTGMGVNEHGVYSAIPWSAEDGRPRTMYDVQRPPTIWERLTARGRRSLIVDPVLAWSPQRTRGVYLSGWQFEDRMVLRGLSVPSIARRELVRRMGKSPRLDDVYGVKRVAALLSWRSHLLRAPGRVADAALDLLRRQAFDLIWLNFAAAHKAGHHLWDPASVVSEPHRVDDLRLIEAGVADVYGAVDAAIGRILEALPGDADVIVFSPTGMGPNTSRADLLPGMLDAVVTGGPRRGETWAGEGQSPIWSLRATFPAAWRERLARGLPDALVADLTTRLYMGVGGRQSRAIAVPGENKGYVRINLKNRERHGSVDRSEMDELLEVVANGLLTFRDPDGSPSVAKVERISEIASEGAGVRKLPDLVVHWGESPAMRLTGVESPLHGAVARRGVGSGRSGNHVDDAWLILSPARARVRDIGRAPRITDIGATACALLDGDPTGLGGTSLLE